MHQCLMREDLKHNASRRLNNKCMTYYVMKWKYMTFCQAIHWRKCVFLHNTFLHAFNKMFFIPAFQHITYITRCIFFFFYLIPHTLWVENVNTDPRWFEGDKINLFTTTITSSRCKHQLYLSLSMPLIKNTYCTQIDWGIHKRPCISRAEAVCQ